MNLKRKDFIKLGALAVTVGAIPGFSSCSAPNDSKESTTTLASLTADTKPISKAERESRIEKAQQLLAKNNMAALVLDCGTSLEYFTGVSWWPSERTMVAIIPAKGSVKYICPAFEEDRLREQITNGNDVYVWQEDESPYRLIVNVLKDAGIQTGTVGMDERLRYFILDGIQKEAPQLVYVSGDPISVECRIIKSEAEIALMQKANNITLAAIQHGVAQLKEGMSQGELSSIIMRAQRDLGGDPDFALCLFGKDAAFPHGTKTPAKLKKGEIVLMDCGCRVHGYSSDITRTIVFGAEPTARQLSVWNLEKEAQAAGFAAAKNGSPCGDIDAASRKVITDAGFGPGYKLPGLPHRTGHGIGMDGHEWGNALKGNKRLLEPGMCFSIEPMIAIPGEFGIRLEDCVHMTTDGPKWFSKTSKSLQEPFG
ncbi:MAG: Xaa-Pro peptidase family protein [Chitinophagaceae bacterium]